MKRIGMCVSIFITLLLLVACDNSFNPKAPYEYLDDGTWSGIFEGYWHGMNENYVFWDVDGTDWDRVYSEYLPKFQALGKYDDDDGKNETAARYFYDISCNLSDGHYGFTLHLDDQMFSGGADFTVMPGFNRLAKANGYSDADIFNGTYGTNEYGSNIFPMLPDEARYERTPNILVNDFKFAFLKDGANLKDVITAHSAYKNEEGKTVLLYSEEHDSETEVTKDWGKVKYFSNSEVVDGSSLVDQVFSKWTLMIVLDNKVSSHDGAGNAVYGVGIDTIAFCGITRQYDALGAPSDVVYTTFSAFSFAGYLEGDKTAPSVYEYLSKFHSYKADGNAKGLVLDVRGNGGGYNLDREYLFGDILSTPQLFGYEKNKTGYNRFDFSGLFPVYVYPESENLKKYYGNTDATHLYDKPVAVITNNLSVSNSEMTVFFVKSLPKGRQIGGRTFGAQGTLAGNYLDLNAGQFTVGKYITQVYTPYAQILDADKESHEGKGCAPDEVVAFNRDDFSLGNDARLEAAFRWVGGNL